MKNYLVIILLLFLIGGCIAQKEESVTGQFAFPNTNLSITVPRNWLKTNIPGNPYPILFTEIHYGIKPNIQLEYYSIDASREQALTSYLNRKKKMYHDYTVINESTFFTKDNVLPAVKIKAKRTNNDNTPIIHVSYIFCEGKKVYILSATCAEPSLGEYENTFDKAIKSIKY